MNQSLTKEGNIFVKPLTHFLLFSILSFFFCCCNTRPKYTQELLSIDSLLQTNPQLGYEKIQSFNKGDLTTKGDSALYDLLLVQARYKTYHDDTLSTTLKDAENFFRGGQDNFNLMRSLYYMGIICHNKGAYGEALVAYDEALEYVDSIQVLYKALIYEAISATASKIQDWHLEYISAHKAWELYHEVDTIPFLNWSQLNLGNIMLAHRKFEEGLNYITQVKENAITIGDSTLLYEALGSLGNAYIWKKDFENGYKYFSQLYEINGGKEMSVKDKNLFLWSMIKTSTHPDSIEKLASEIKNDAGENSVTYEYYEYKGDWKKAHKALQSEHWKQNKEYAFSASSNAHYLLTQLHQEKIKSSEATIKEIKYRNLFIIAFAVVIITVVVVIIIVVVVLKNRRITELLNTVKLLQSNISSSSKSLDINSSEILISLFRNLDNLYSEYYHLPEEQQNAKGIYSSIKKNLLSLQSDSSLLTNLENEINNRSNDLLRDVYDKMKTPTENQRRLLVFLYYGFTYDSICALFGIKPEVLYNRKTRLKKALSISTSPRTQELLSIVFGK